MIKKRNRGRRIWLWVLIVLLIGILFFGLRPKGFRLENGVAWLEDRPGIRFSENGLAFTQDFLKQVDIDAFRDNGFSMEIALKSSDHKGGDFGFILSIQAGRDRDQLLVGQWRSHVIVMNGDDYSHKRKDPRISVDTASQKGKPIFLT
ncbi:hypothetical protein OAT93_00515, partial [bacterium]|nr:hypothetical protein [bacterium]